MSAGNTTFLARAGTRDSVMSFTPRRTIKSFLSPFLVSGFGGSQRPPARDARTHTQYPSIHPRHPTFFYLPRFLPGPYRSPFHMDPSPPSGGWQAGRPGQVEKSMGCDVELEARTWTQLQPYANGCHARQCGCIKASLMRTTSLCPNVPELLLTTNIVLSTTYSCTLFWSILLGGHTTARKTNGGELPMVDGPRFKVRAPRWNASTPVQIRAQALGPGFPGVLKGRRPQCPVVRVGSFFLPERPLLKCSLYTYTNTGRERYVLM